MVLSNFVDDLLPIACMTWAVSLSRTGLLCLRCLISLAMFLHRSRPLAGGRFTLAHRG